jgi:hypothetical protein
MQIATGIITDEVTIPDCAMVNIKAVSGNFTILGNQSFFGNPSTPIPVTASDPPITFFGMGINPVRGITITPEPGAQVAAIIGYQ